MNNVVTIHMQGKSARWHVVLRYRSTKAGIVDVHHDIEELDDLPALVERGPDWNSLIDCVVTLNRTSTPDLTVEQAARL
ncbi:MAG: hypothetical protein WA973_00515 [Mesorhizobium sp.]